MRSARRQFTAPLNRMHELPQLLRRDSSELGGFAHVFVIGANELGESFRGHLLRRRDFRAKADQPFRGGSAGTQSLRDRLLDLVDDIRRRLRRGDYANIALRREVLRPSRRKSECSPPPSSGEARRWLG